MKTLQIYRLILAMKSFPLIKPIRKRQLEAKEHAEKYNGIYTGAIRGVKLTYNGLSSSPSEKHTLEFISWLRKGKSKRAKFIRDSILSGELDGKVLYVDGVYHYPTHAHVIYFYIKHKEYL